MAVKPWLLVVVLALSACSHQLAACRGPVTPLNVGQWHPTAEDLRP